MKTQAMSKGQTSVTTFSSRAGAFGVVPHMLELVETIHGSPGRYIVHKHQRKRREIKIENSKITRYEYGFFFYLCPALTASCTC
jgi:hypothetical protein